MSNLGSVLKVGALACALALSAQTFAASTFKVPVNYSVELVDGKTSDFGYSRFTREITLEPGRHQLVFLFEGAFGAARDSRIVQAANPIVVEINNMPDNVSYSFNYDIPTTETEAEKFSRSQKVQLVNANTKAPLSAEEANYYILTSDSGFALLRDYRQDLASVGRLYAPAPVLEEMKKQSEQHLNASGVPTIQARSGGNFYAHDGSQAAASSTGMSATVSSAAAANQAAAAQAASGQPQQVQSFSSPTQAATYNQLVEMYNGADDNTKLQFVKYIMSH